MGFYGILWDFMGFIGDLKGFYEGDDFAQDFDGGRPSNGHYTV
jgi:hypothetical protein